jgi:hypothetical protein
MTPLVPDLVRGMDFAQLFELGRSLIPSISPDWTDHNTHDPGIMLLELLAWTADAQIYSLARTRRDERLAYARLLGVRPRGPCPARGLVWPTPNTLPPPPGTVVDATTPAVPTQDDAPTFRVAHRIGLTTATLTRLGSRLADGRTPDWTGANAQDGATFLPFGSAPAPGDRLVLELDGPVGTGEAPLAIGVEIVAQASEVAGVLRPDAPVRLRCAVEDDAGERPAVVVRDTTDGLLRSGVVLVVVPAAVGARQTLTIRSATGGFLLPPRVRRVALNVLPIRQLEKVSEDEPAFGRGLPDQQYALAQSGLVYDGIAPPVHACTSEGTEWRPWTPVADLGACRPSDQAFVVDPAAGTLTFGNGVNGAVPPAGATLRVRYCTSRGTAGNLGTGVAWAVGGLAGTYGTNGEPIAGGLDGCDLEALRAVAVRRARDVGVWVTSTDLVQAALACRDLRVSRAVELPPSPLWLRGTRTLVVLGPHDADDATVESAEWLEEIRARLAPGIPLGQRLRVVAPRRVEVRVRAQLVAAPRLAPATVLEGAGDRLRKALAVAPDPDASSGWPLGRDVTSLGVQGWLRGVEGVARVGATTLLRDGRAVPTGVLVLGPTELPRLVFADGDLTVVRWGSEEAS